MATAPYVTQFTYQNPDATIPLVLPILVVANTSDEDIERNIRLNAARDLPWAAAVPASDVPAVMVGGGPSVADHLDDIRALQAAGGIIFAMNAAHQFLTRNGITPDHQVIVDAKPETAQLVARDAKSYLLGSQCDAATVETAAADRTTLWHLAIDDIEDLFPPERVKRGNYVLTGGGATVGNSALCLAYALGHRHLHVFGYDSSHREGASHAYAQPMNALIPTVAVEWGGRNFISSVAMKAQAEKFQITAQMLKAEGCEIAVYGDGFLQAMYTTPAENLTERDKYRLMWQFDGYRQVSPGEASMPLYLDLANPKGLIIDFGCGTGRAALALKRAGHGVICVDFASNCRDPEAMELPFIEWDLTVAIPLKAPNGICCDVMEHIPTDDVRAVIGNIMASAKSVFFQISTVDDSFGALIGSRLHNTVRPYRWWADLFAEMGYAIAWSEHNALKACFLVTTS